MHMHRHSMVITLFLTILGLLTLNNNLIEQSFHKKNLVQKEQLNMFIMNVDTKIIFKMYLKLFFNLLHYINLIIL